MFPVLVEAAIRATVIAAGVALVLLTMRVGQAALRHAVWTGVVATMLLLPAWSVWGPKTKLPLLPVDSWQGTALSRTAEKLGVELGSEPLRDGQIVAPSPKASRDWGTYILILYCAGVGVLLLRLSIGIVRVRSLVRGARVSDGKLTHAACVAPVTVGWRRPMVILPEGWGQWPERQRAVILAHEQEHVRRRDPLIQCLALLNRAVFWFHPLAWWLERELSRLAEEACDGAVLSCGHEPREYAECLLALARSVMSAGTRVRMLGMAAAGAELPQRIRKIFSSGQPQRISRLRLASVVLACAATAATFATGRPTHAQPASPTFEVASIKPNKSGEQGGSSRFTANSYIGTNVTLRRVVGLAYAPIQEFTGGPGWIESDRFDITAKAEGNPGREQLQLMLRCLLADRFKLVVHKQTRDSAAYALVLARSDGKLGSSLHPTKAVCTPPDQVKGPPEPGRVPAGVCGVRLGNGALAGRGISMERLAAELIVVGRMVVDRTGLTGIFDMDVQWTPDEEGTNADLFRALREQLGLKLEATRAPVEVIVIDSAGRPSEN
jgi:bla regulator protein BlaR1